MMPCSAAGHCGRHGRQPPIRGVAIRAHHATQSGRPHNGVNAATGPEQVLIAPRCSGRADRVEPEIAEPLTTRWPLAARARTRLIELGLSGLSVEVEDRRIDAE